MTSRKTFGLVFTLTLLAAGLAATALDAGQEVLLDCKVLRVVSAKKLVVAVPSGEFKGRYSLGFRTIAPQVKRGDRGRIRADRDVLVERKGPVRVSFKGSDEELQAIIDWLGSLE